ncbi:MAG: PAS domain S-box protein [Holophaga sp.]|nr:PAS domain S-box protein [Holophaga sp.]
MSMCTDSELPPGKDSSDWESRYQHLFNGVPYGIVYHDAQGFVVSANAMAQQILGLTLDQLQGRTSMDPCWQSIHEDGSAFPGDDHPASVVLRTGQAVNDVVMGVFNPERGDIRWINLSAVPITRSGDEWPYQVMVSLVDITERKQAEISLREAEWKFRALFEMGPIGVAYHRMVYDDAGKPVDYVFLDANQKYIELTGVDPRGKTVLQAFPGIEKDPFDWIGTFGHVAKSGQSIRFEQYLHVNDRWYDCVGYQYEPDHFVAAFFEISERKRAEEALRASEARHRSILNASPDAVVITDLGGLILGVPPLALKLFHCEHDDQLLGHVVTDFIAPEDRERAANRIGLMHQGIMTGPGEYRALRVDGTSFFMEANGEFIRDDEGNPGSIVFVIRDITAHKQAQDSLRESNELLSLFVHHSPIYAYLKDVTATESRVLQASENFRAMVGIPGSEMVGKTMAELFPAEMAAKMTADDWDVVSQGKALEFEEAFNDRSYITLKFPIRQGQRTLLAGFTIDITARKQAEEKQRHLQAQLQQVQKMESLGSLAGGVAHDMNNVLGAILGLASVHLEIQPADSPAYRAFETISQAAIRGGKMVKSLLNFARQSPGEVRELDMNEILREEVRLLERTTLAKIQLEMDLAGDLRPMRGDANALTHAFMNLCVNAVDAMPGNGTLTLRTRNVDNDWIEVVVEDTGTGMTPEVLARAFDPFYTTKEVGKGTGLGLSMVYSAVKTHEGQMEIQSLPGHGTSVRLRFPACPLMVPESLPPVDEALPDVSPKGLRVLLVDDDPLIQSSTQTILVALNHEVAPAFCGEEALAKLEGGYAPDVVILDMNMPGLGGLGTLPRLRQLRPNLPVLLATGRVDQVAMDLVESHPLVILMTKPFGIKELQNTLMSLPGASNGTVP